MTYNFEFVALGLNVVVAFVNVLMARRLRAVAREQESMVEKLIAVAGLASQPESGAPPQLQEIARAALPPGVRVTVTPIDPGEDPPWRS
jgi:hypothetical protein